jgi:hypothetical protein
MLMRISLQVKGLLDGIAFVHSKNSQPDFGKIKDWEKWEDTEVEVGVPWMHGAIKPVHSPYQRLPLRLILALQSSILIRHTPTGPSALITNFAQTALFPPPFPEPTRKGYGIGWNHEEFRYWERESLPYIAPEAMSSFGRYSRKDIIVKRDVWGVGLVIYEVNLPVLLLDIRT